MRTHGAAPIKKNGAYEATEGVTPIAKNIRVVDESGNEYEATYPKRAKGMVKNGRARFVDEHTLCLARPPNHLEDAIMEKTIGVYEQENERETVRNEVTQDKIESLTIADILSRIDKIIEEKKYILEAFNSIQATLSDMQPGDVSGNDSRGEIAAAFGNIVKAREETNRQTLKFLEKMYDDLMPNAQREQKNPNRLEQTISMLQDLKMPSEYKNELIKEAIHRLG